MYIPLLNIDLLRSFSFSLWGLYAMSANQDIIDGQTEEYEPFYFPFLNAVIILSLVFLNLSPYVWFPVANLFYQPLQVFLLSQLPNLFLYYTTVYNAFYTNKQFHSPHKSKATLRFFATLISPLFLLFPLPGTDETIASIYNWLCKPLATQYKENTTIHAESFLAKLPKIVLHVLLVLKIALRSMAFVHHTLSAIIGSLGQRFHSAVVWGVTHSPLLALSLITGKNFYTYTVLSTASPITFIQLAFSVVCLMSHYQMLDPLVNDVLFQFNQLNKFLFPFCSPQRLWGILTNIRDMINELSTHLYCYLAYLYVFLYSHRIYERTFYLLSYFVRLVSWPLGQLIVKIKVIKPISYDDYSASFLIFENLFNCYHSTFSSAYINWSIRKAQVPQRNPFRLNESNIKPDEFVTQVWTPHLSDFLELDNFFQHDAYCRPGIRRHSTPLLSFDSNDRIPTLYDKDGYFIKGSPLQWAASGMHMPWKTSINQGESSLTDEQLKSGIAAIIKFFTNDENSDDRAKLKKRANELTTPLDSSDNPQQYLDEKLRSAGDRCGRNILTRDAFLEKRNQFISSVHRCISSHASSPDDQKRKHIFTAISHFLQTVPLCPPGVIKGLEESIFELSLTSGLSATVSAYLAQYQLNKGVQKLSLSHEMRSNSQETRVNIRVWDNSVLSMFFGDAFVPSNFLSPNKMLYGQYVEASIDQQGITAENRHSDVVAGALYGYDLDSLNYSSYDRNSITLYPQLQVENLSTFHHAEPLAWQLKHLLALDESSLTHLMPLEYFSSRNDGHQPSIFYEEFTNLLKVEGYLDKSDRSTDQARLIELIRVQNPDIFQDESLLQFYAQYRASILEDSDQSATDLAYEFLKAPFDHVSVIKQMVSQPGCVNLPKESIDLFIKKMLVAPLLTLFLHHGIMYRGASDCDTDRQAVYTSLGHLRTNLAQQKSTSHRLRQVMYTLFLCTLAFVFKLIPFAIKIVFLTMLSTLQYLAKVLLVGVPRSLLISSPHAFYSHNYFFVGSVCRMIVRCYAYEYQAHFLGNAWTLGLKAPLSPFCTGAHALWTKLHMLIFTTVSASAATANQLVIQPIVWMTALALTPAFKIHAFILSYLSKNLSNIPVESPDSAENIGKSQQERKQSFTNRFSKDFSYCYASLESFTAR